MPTLLVIVSSSSSSSTVVDIFAVCVRIDLTNNTCIQNICLCINQYYRNATTILTFVNTGMEIKFNAKRTRVDLFLFIIALTNHNSRGSIQAENNMLN